MTSELDRDLAAMAAAAKAAIAYRGQVATAARTPVATYEDSLAAFAEPTPEAGQDPEQVIADLAARAAPGIRAMTAPRFFGWVIGSSDPTGVAADWLAAAWGQNAGNLVAAPAAAAVETVAAGWLLDLLGLPPTASVGFVTGATIANFVGLAAARGEVLRRAGWDVEADGLFGAPPISVLIGADAHATVYSGLRYLGLGARRVTTIETDDAGRMRPAALERALGKVAGPAVVIAQAGQINTGASDPFAMIAPMAREAGAWLHVDGAFGLWARAAPSRAHLVSGIDQADSWATDGHKWLQTPYDCGYAIVKDAAAHRRAMGITASYLPSAAEDQREPSALVPELSRRARGFATWAMIRKLGRSGIAGMVERCCAIAARMAERLAKADGVTLVCPPELNQFMIRLGQGSEEERDRLTLETAARIQEDAVAYLGSALWRGRWVLRVSVTSAATTEEDADMAVEAVLRAWRGVRSEALAAG